jgi:hypothetical protein
VKQEIEGRFHANLARVQSLIGVYASDRTGLSLAASFPMLGADLEAMMQRRHLIVHRADRNTFSASAGTYEVRSMDPSAVEGWVSAVESFGKTVLAQC